MSTLFSSLWPVDRTLFGAKTPGQSGPGSKGNIGALSITEASPSNCLVSYLGHSLGESYPSAEIQLVYPIALADCARIIIIIIIIIIMIIIIIIIVIHWDMCRKFQFDHTNKWYIHNPAPVLENDSHKLLWDFNIQMDHLIPARRPDFIIINQKKRESAKLSTLLSRRTTE